MPSLSTQIEQAANDPAAASVDGQSVTARSIGDLIKADQYLAVKTAGAQRRRGIGFSQLIPNGTMPDTGGVTTGFDQRGW